MQLRLKVMTEDRIGMVMDILQVLYRYRLNLRALEVEPGVVYAEIWADEHIPFSLLRDSLEQVPDVLGVELVSQLPQEIREQYINAVLEATSEGILAVDREGVITTYNHSAERILNLKENVVGKKIGEVFSEELPILDTLATGRGYDNREIVLKNKGSVSHYVASGRPILNADNQPVGAVATIKDMASVMELVYAMTRQPMITFAEILGNSPALLRVKELAQTVARSNSTVLIRGESGTGKELFARAIHMASPRRDKPFVPVNCAALPPSLLESELFGYEEGSFTGAKKGGKQGLFKYADGGTIFLDEIGELPVHLQVKLLRVLQDYKIRRIGSDEEVPVDVRVIAATNRNLEEMVETGDFREDLYYRLSVIPILLPPLRDRKEDIPVLTQTFIEKLSKKINKGVTGISEEAVAKLQSYDWPGNIRELSNVIERALNICADRIEVGDIVLKNEEIIGPWPTAQPTDKKLKDHVDAVEKLVIAESLKKHKSIREAARVLGVSHGTILNKMKRLNISATGQHADQR